MTLMDIDHSVTRLQEQVGTLQHDREQDREAMREIRDDVKATRESVQRLEIAFASQPRCAAPSTCLVLQPKVIEHDKRIQDVENIVQQGRGAWKAISFLSALGGGGVGALLAKLFGGSN